MRERRQSWRALQTLRAQGKARSLGVSNFTIAHLSELLAEGETIPFVNQVEFSPLPSLTEAHRASKGVSRSSVKAVWLILFTVAVTFPAGASAQKLLLAHVAVNPSQGMLHLAKDSGILAKYGFTADVLLIPGTPRTIQALIAGDLDYVAAGAPASLRARAQGADVVILSTLANSSAQRVFVRPDSPLSSFKDLKGKIIGVTQYGSGGDTFLRGALRKHAIKESEVTILQMGGTPGVAQGLESGRIEVGVLGDSGLLLVFRGRAKPLKGASAREMGFRGVDAPLTTTDRKIKTDRAGVIRFMQAYLETIHFFQTNKAGTARILQKYMRGVSEEHITLWCDDLRAIIRQVPYADEESLRTELEMMNIPGGQIPPGYINNSILDEIKKSGFIDKLYSK